MCHAIHFFVLADDEKEGNDVFWFNEQAYLDDDVPDVEEETSKGFVPEDFKVDSDDEEGAATEDRAASSGTPG